MLALVTFLGACEKEISSPAEDQGIRNLRAFAKLYGYVKYFHPSDEASKVDWDIFAIHGVREVKAAADSEELRYILEDLFLLALAGLELHFR